LFKIGLLWKRVCLSFLADYGILRLENFPTTIPVGEFDLFLDEDIAYAQRLLQAGVPIELHIYRGCFHGSDIFVPDAAVSRRFAEGCEAALKRALHG